MQSSLTLLFSLITITIKKVFVLLGIILYLFQLTNLLNPSFNCPDNSTLSSVSKVTTKRKSFATVFLKVAAVPAFATFHASYIFSSTDNDFPPHFNESSILQLIKDISNDIHYSNILMVQLFLHF